MSKEGEPREDYSLQAPVFRRTRSDGNPRSRDSSDRRGRALVCIRPSRARTLLSQVMPEAEPNRGANPTAKH